MIRDVLTVVLVLLVCARAASLPEGAACEDKGIAGTCRKSQSCPSYAVLKRHQDNTEVTECSRNGNDVVVCCTDCKIDDASKAAVTLDGVVWKTGGERIFYDKCVDYAASLPYPCKSGKKAVPKKVYDAQKKCHNLDVDVVDDPSAAEEKTVDFPSLALLGYKYNASVPPQWLCQGFIISERFIITTAHCGRSFGVDNGPLSIAAVGVEQRISNSHTPAPASWQLLKVKKFTAHPQWQAPKKYNDIGLLETETDIKFSENVLPLCISDQPAIPDAVTTDVMGIHGKHGNRKVENLKRLGEAECSAKFGPSRHLAEGINHEQQICYEGFNEEKELCWGSSGRPVHVPSELKCVNSAIGFISFGFTCSFSSDLPTVYTRLYAYLPWIRSVVWP